MTVEIRHNPDASIDEIIAINCRDVHVEQMSPDGWYMGITASDGSYWQFWFGAKNRKSAVEFRHTETSLPLEMCPRPANGAPDHLTVAECIRRGECGCNQRPTPSVNDIPDNELLQCVIRNLHKRGRSREKLPMWSIVADKFALGSTYACQLCRLFGLDPDEMVKR